MSSKAKSQRANKGAKSSKSAANANKADQDPSSVDDDFGEIWRLKALSL